MRRHGDAPRFSLPGLLSVLLASFLAVYLLSCGNGYRSYTREPEAAAAAEPAVPAEDESAAAPESTAAPTPVPTAAPTPFTEPALEEGCALTFDGVEVEGGALVHEGTR